MSEKKDFYCRCGLCDIKLNSTKEWDAHKKSVEHKASVTLLNLKIILADFKNEHYDLRGFVKEIQALKKTKKKVKKLQKIPNQPINFDSISDAYAVIQVYEMGGIAQSTYLNVCKYALEYFRKTYGKDDFRFRELFAHMQGDAWENTFEIRSLLHCEVIGCPHGSIAECNKYKSEMQLKHLKNRKCQHCRYLEGVKEKWMEKSPR